MISYHIKIEDNDLQKAHDFRKPLTIPNKQNNVLILLKFQIIVKVYVLVTIHCHPASFIRMATRTTEMSFFYGSRECPKPVFINLASLTRR